ncbi:N-acetylmuramoyl-L-alanine amidase [Aneurinibacillus sp. Ricciae_BoGa-3]|uniref:N-acetylmuramoyl-L-alanine amidase n=1 Tax=Aneurinibacillus sp. Ricciae_BoGa-3 TaxID=3022697 RepID=UPI0023422EE7|nr:N-acetylmuramoyl-L-alanine amidase [Aneurinibacillus sp. Ricciae_BoGa-3]WCK54984.1 N-acetylmuramoyl-L-alanine amidase [Aneurinibacillus sp. Ricciae_BoGa-3]
MRKFGEYVGMFLFLLIGLIFTSGSALASTVQMWVNGALIKSDPPPQTINGRLMVPVMFVKDELGLDVKWDAKSRRVTILNAGRTVELVVNSKDAKVNSAMKRLDTAPVIIQGRTYLPFRSLGELLGTVVGWESDTQSIVINRPVSLKIMDKPLSINVYRLNGGYYAAAQSVAEKAGYKITKNGKNIILSKGADQRTFKPNAVQNGYRIIDDAVVIPVTAFADLEGVKGSWNDEKTLFSVNKKQINVLSISKKSDGITIKTDGPTSFNGFKMSAPNRIVLDMQNALVMKTMQVAGNANNPAIKAVRFSQYAPGVVRVVMELNGKANYSTQSSNDGISVKLKDIQLPAAPSTPVVKPVSAPVSVPVSVPGQEPSPSAGGNLAPAGTPLSSKYKVTIVLDAGHGGVDVGAIGVNKTLEKDFTISLVNKLAADLGQDPKFHVILTRHGDEFPSLTDRVRIANDDHADLFFSIHANSATPSANGTETYYYTDRSRRFAEMIHRHVVEATGFLDRKVKTAGFQVIKYTKMPALLEEVGFITNPENNRNMMDEAFQQKVADSMYAGIKEYCGEN